MTQYQKMMNHGFVLLTTTTFPDELDEVQRIELLQYFIQHFQELEEYEKCSVLKNRISTVMLPIAKKRGRPKKSKN